MKKRNGFTLVELLAVIVILAIILVIAVPSIMSTIADARKSSYKSSAMMVASAAETQYMVSQTSGNFVDSGYPGAETAENTKFYKGTSTAPAPCGSWAGIDANEHGTCTYYIDNNTAHVTLTAPTSGTSKFKNCVATGTKANVSITGDNCGK